MKVCLIQVYPMVLFYCAGETGRSSPDGRKANDKEGRARDRIITELGEIQHSNYVDGMCY